MKTPETIGKAIAKDSRFGREDRLALLHLT